MPRRLIDLSGQQFGRLLVSGQAPKRRGVVYWSCLCDCGKTTDVYTGNLKRGATKSCGCLWKESTTGRFVTTHGRTGTSEYRCFWGIVTRCTNSKSKFYSDYGGRGIENRFASFVEFYAVLGPRPRGMSVDRIDNNGHYEPGNVRWATKLEQARNTRKNRFLSLNGRTQILAEWARETGVRAPQILARLKGGWTVERALTEPIDRRYSHPRVADASVQPCQ